jgi:uroporphyrinogen decarboxylase
METKVIKKEFGKDLSFWGGSCDNNILAFETLEKVREETKRRINDLTPGGGLYLHQFILFRV